MSKPEPVEYKLRCWEIIYNSTYYESSQATGTQHYKAIITWEAKAGDNKDTSYESECFVTFQEAKKWIDKQL